MPGRPPTEIWEEGVDEGERRLTRGRTALAATAFAGGVDILFGVLALVIVTGALTAVLPEDTAHVLASVALGVGFAFVVVGRSELFTENFLIPVGTVFAGRASAGSLLRLWGISLVINFAAIAAFAALLSVVGVLESSTLKAVGTAADTLGDRNVVPSLISAIAAGTIMTLFTWVVAASDGTSARILAAFIAGFILAAPSLNHAVVGFAEMSFGIFSGTAASGWGDLVRTVGLGIVGNLIGGVGLVFTTRLAQVRGEPRSESGGRASAPEEDNRRAQAPGSDGREDGAGAAQKWERTG